MHHFPIFDETTGEFFWNNNDANWKLAHDSILKSEEGNSKTVNLLHGSLVSLSHEFSTLNDNCLGEGNNSPKKEKNHKLIPIGTTIVGIICSGGWLFFGIIVNDINCIIPNLIGLLSSIFNTFIWIFFYVRTKIINKRNQLYSEETIDQKNKVEIK